MGQIYLIHASRLEAGLYLGLSIASALVLAAYIELDLYGVSAVVLLLLFGAQRYLALTREPELRLQLFGGSGQVALQQCGQTHFYMKYKVYPTRWFAILKLIDSGYSRTLFLNPARFDSDADWRNCRREIARLEAMHVA